MSDAMGGAVEDHDLDERVEDETVGNAQPVAAQRLDYWSRQSNAQDFLETGAKMNYGTVGMENTPYTASLNSFSHDGALPV